MDYSNHTDTLNQDVQEYIKIVKTSQTKSKVLKTYRAKILTFKKNILQLLHYNGLINERNCAIFELITSKLLTELEDFSINKDVESLTSYFLLFLITLNENIIEKKVENQPKLPNRSRQTQSNHVSPKTKKKPITTEPRLQSRNISSGPAQKPKPSGPAPRVMPSGLSRNTKPSGPAPRVMPSGPAPRVMQPESARKLKPSGPAPRVMPSGPAPARQSIPMLSAHELRPLPPPPLQLGIRSPSPHRRSPSPHRRSPSPHRRSPSPHRRSRSPSQGKRSPSPPRQALPPSANNLAKGEITRHQRIDDRNLLNLRLLTINGNTCFFDSILVSLFVNNPVFYELFFGQNNYTGLVESKNNFYNDYSNIIDDIRKTMKTVVDNMYKNNDKKNNVNTIRKTFIEHSSILLNKYYFNQNILIEFRDFMNKRFAGVDGFLMGLLEIFQIPYNFKILTSNGNHHSNLDNILQGKALPNDYPFLLIGRHTSNVLQKQGRDDSIEIKHIIDTYYKTNLDKNLQSNILKFFNRIDTLYLKDICNNDILYYKILFSLYQLIDMDSFINYIYSEDFDKKFKFYNNYLHYIVAFSGLQYDVFKVNLPKHPTKDNLKLNINKIMTQIGSNIGNHKFKNFDELDTEVARLERLFNNPEYTPPDIIPQDGHNYKLISIIIGPKLHYTALIEYRNEWYFYNDSTVTNIRDFRNVAKSYDELIHNNHNDFKMRGVLYVYVLQR